MSRLAKWLDDGPRDKGSGIPVGRWERWAWRAVIAAFVVLICYHAPAII